MVFLPAESFRQAKLAANRVLACLVTWSVHSPCADGNGRGFAAWTTTVRVSAVEVRTVREGVAPFTMSALADRSRKFRENWPGGGWYAELGPSGRARRRWMSPETRTTALPVRSRSGVTTDVPDGDAVVAGVVTDPVGAGCGPELHATRRSVDAAPITAAERVPCSMVAAS